MALRAICIYCDFTTVTSKKKSIYKLVYWLLTTGYFPEFRLTERYRVEVAQGTKALATKIVCRTDTAYY